MKQNFRQRPSLVVGARSQTGLTLVELLVAVTLGLLITLAALAALLIGRQGFSSVDNASQLRENSRFAASMLQRVVIQAGYEQHRDGGGPSNWRYFCASGGLPCGDQNGDRNPGIVGFDNALLPTLNSSLLANLASGTRSTGCGGVTDTSCVNGSDILVVRYWGDSRAGVATGDGSMINCSGASEPDGDVPAYSIFYVEHRGASGEPTLACAYRDNAGTWQRAPLVEGVEAFQVLYGVDKVSPNAVPPTGDTDADGVPDRYLRASEMTVAGNVDATMDNWRRVRSVRIGLLIRGPINSAADKASTARTYDVLGPDFTDPTNDVKSRLQVPADGRLRQTLVFTVNMRNPQFVVPAQWLP